MKRKVIKRWYLYIGKPWFADRSAIVPGFSGIIIARTDADIINKWRTY